MKSTTVLLLFILISQQEYAQKTIDTIPTQGLPHPPIPVELFAGNKYLNFQFLINKRFSQKSRFSFFNFTNFNADYNNDKTKNEYLTQPMLNFEIIKGISVGAGAIMHSFFGFRPTAGLQYLFANRKFLVVLMPRFDLTENYNFETIVNVEYKPKISGNMGLYSSIQAVYNYNTELKFHERSFVYARLGISYRQYQFGMGVDFDRYGPLKTETYSYGIFLKTNIFN